MIESGRTEWRALMQNGRGRVLLAVAVPWGLLLGARMALPVLLPFMQSEFGIRLSTAGLLVTLLWLGSAVGQLPGGILADRRSEGRLMAVSVGLVALALAGVVLAPTVIVVFIVIPVWGFAMSLYPIARITILSEVYPERLGSALGLTMATGDLGQTLLPPVAGALAVLIAWQAGLGVVIPALLLASLVIWRTVPDSSPANRSDERGLLETIRAVGGEFRRPTMVFMSGILVLFFFFWQAFTALYPTYLVAEKGLSPSMASVLFGLFFAAGAVVKPVAGMVYDRIGMRWALIGVLLGPVVGLVVLPLVDGVVLLAGVTLAISTMLGNGAVTQSFVAEQFPPETQGTGLGVIRTGSAVIGSSGPVVFGLVAERGFFDEGYLVLAMILVVVILLTYRMPDSAGIE
jgi:MFS family permease